MAGLFFDARFIRPDFHDGISRFSLELIKQLNSKTDVTAVISDERVVDLLPAGIKTLTVNSPDSIKEFFIAKKLNQAGAKVVYSPMQIMGSWGRKYRLILTLHDLIYYRHRKPPTDLNLFIKIIWWLYHLTYIPQRILLNRADAIVTVSKTTERLIAKHKLTRRQVFVVYNGVEQSKVQKREFPKTRNLVYTGSFMPYKNVETLIRATGKLEGFTLQFLSKISNQREKDLSKLAAECKAKVVFHRGVDEVAYQKNLLEAFALVTASKDEGFGIPIIEAMAQGTPTVVSNLDVFREIVGESGRFFDPSSPDELAEEIAKLEDKQLWEELSRLSLIRSKEFSWGASAESLLKVIRSVS